MNCPECGSLLKPLYMRDYNKENMRTWVRTKYRYCKECKEVKE